MAPRLRLRNNGRVTGRKRQATDRDSLLRRIWRRRPKLRNPEGTELSWWVKELFLGAGLVLILALYQIHADDEREADSQRIEAQRQADSERLENLRFVRDHSTKDPDLPRPFIGLDLSGKSLSLLQLENARFAGANLHKADLNLANLQGANFEKADLSGANLALARMRGVWFSYANLQGARLHEVDLRGANFQGADLRSSLIDNLISANLSGVKLQRATLRGRIQDINFTGADLRGVDFSVADFVGQVKLSGACYDSNTRWPKDFKPSAPAECNRHIPPAPKDWTPPPIMPNLGDK